MPLLNALDFAADRLLVSYRASPEPQNVTLHFELKGASNGQPIAFFAIWSQIHLGMAGSDVFAPTACDATRPHGKFLSQGRVTPKEYKVVLTDVRGVAPIHLRLLIERLRMVGGNTELASLDIRGDLPVDESPLSVSERQVRQWLDDPAAYPRRWPKLSFPVEEKEFTGKGVSAHIGFADAPDDQKKADLEMRVLEWRNAAVNYVSDDGEFVPQKLGPTMPKVVWKKSEAVASIELFEHAREPSMNLLLNVLERAHHEIGPITHVTLTT
jgi:hypothetical protein